MLPDYLLQGPIQVWCGGWECHTCSKLSEPTAGPRGLCLPSPFSGSSRLPVAPHSSPLTLLNSAVGEMRGGAASNAQPLPVAFMQLWRLQADTDLQSSLFPAAEFRRGGEERGEE